MSLGTSPTAATTGGPVTSQEFAKYIKYFQDSHKVIVKWTQILSNAPPSGVTIKSPDGGEDTVIRKSDIARYSAVFNAELGDLKKIYANRKRKTTRTNTQLKSLFYVSDQLVAFYTKANLGPIDPETGKGKLADKIQLLTEKRMATSGILMSLFARYIDANGLKGESGRFKVDARMKKAFATTNLRMGGTDISKRKVAKGTSEEKAEDIARKLAEGKSSAFDRISGRSDKSGKEMYNKDGMLYTSMCTMNNFFRIPGPLLTDSERDELSSEENIEAAKEIQQVLTYIKNFKKRA